MKTVELTNSSLPTMVDDKDFERVSKFKWYLSNKKGYARRSFDDLPLHHFIRGMPRTGKQTDPRSTNKLDCRRKNLREATHRQNMSNRNRFSNNSSGFKGVYFDKFKRDEKVWKAYIGFRGVLRHLGYFNNPIDAAKAYDKAAKRFHGSFARPNFPMRFPR